MAQLTTSALDRGPRHDAGQPTPPWPGRPGQLTIAPAADQMRTQRRLALQQRPRDL
jgi:hypothetical protein